MAKRLSRRAISGSSSLAGVEQAGAALLVVDGQDYLVEASGWARCFGAEPPARLAPDAASIDAFGQGLAAVVGEARRRNAPVRRLLAVTLDRKRLYAVSAGPAAGVAGAVTKGRGGTGGGAVAVVAMECTEGHEAGPREGEAIRQLAHDLRTPLASMSGAVEMLESGRLGRPTPQQSRMLGLLNEGVQRMLQMIDGATAPYRTAARARAAGGDRAAD
jgi:signal transduction histidine kinase